MNQQKTVSTAGTRGVETLLGNPRKAIIKIATPMVIAMSVQTIYNLADAAWVAGISKDAMSAVGYFFPVLLVIIAMSVGVGIGGGSAISRSIGRDDKRTAELVAEHMLVLSLIISITLTVILLLGQRHLFLLLGAGGAIEETLSYSTVMSVGVIALFFPQVANAILRSEGDAARAMISLSIGAGLNIVLDPFFIFSELPFATFIPGLGLGVTGAAMATVISMSLASILLFYWLFIKRNTYVTFNFSVFTWKRNILLEIVRVGIPAMFSQASMAIMMGAVIKALAHVAGDNGVAVFNTGWRIVMVAILPLLGMGTAVVAVIGAASGQNRADKMRSAFLFAVGLGLAAEIILAVLVYMFAPSIVAVFTWAEKTKPLAPDIVIMLRTICISFPAIVGGILSSSLFQGAGRGVYSLLFTLLRTIVLASGLAWLFGVVLGWNEQGVYWGIITANISVSVIAFIGANLFIASRKRLWATNPLQ